LFSALVYHRRWKFIICAKAETQLRASLNISFSGIRQDSIMMEAQTNHEVRSLSCLLVVDLTEAASSLDQYIASNDWMMSEQ
jgi:hypothetical protein